MFSIVVYHVNSIHEVLSYGQLISFFQGTSRLEASLPMTGFLEQLPADKSLKFLDLSAAWREAQMEKLIQDGAPQL